MHTILLNGFLLGIGAALSVGPIFVTIIQEAVTRGFAASFRVILGSAVADAILLIPALAFVWIIQHVVAATFWVGIIGTLFFVYLGISALRDTLQLWHSNAPMVAPGHSWSFWKGLLGNLSNPLSWSFWLATGTPTMLHSYQEGSWLGLLLFTVTWFVVASGLESIIALAVARSQRVIGVRGQALLSGLSAGVFLILAASVFTMSVLG